MNVCHGKTQRTVGGASAGQEVLGGIKRQTEQAMASMSVSRIPQSSPVSLGLPVPALPEPLPWLPSTTDCDLDKWAKWTPLSCECFWPGFLSQQQESKWRHCPSISGLLSWIMSVTFDKYAYAEISTKTLNFICLGYILSLRRDWWGIFIFH